MCFFQGTTTTFVGFLLFEDLPLTNIVCGLLGNAAYFLLLQDFPYFVLTSPGFIGSVGKYMYCYYRIALLLC